MLEIMAIGTLVVTGLFIVALFAVLGFFLKIVFKVVLFPVWLLFGLLKVVFAIVGIVLLMTVASLIGTWPCSPRQMIVKRTVSHQSMRFGDNPLSTQVCG